MSQVCPVCRLPTPGKLGIDLAMSEDFKVNVDGNVKAVYSTLRPPAVIRIGVLDKLWFDV